MRTAFSPELDGVFTGGFDGSVVDGFTSERRGEVIVWEEGVSVEPSALEYENIGHIV